MKGFAAFIQPTLTFQVQNTPLPADQPTATFEFAGDPVEPGAPGKNAGAWVLSRDGNRLGVVISLGEPGKFNAEMARRAGAALSRWMQEANAPHVGMDLDHIAPLQPAEMTAALLEGIRLGAYRFTQFKSKNEPRAYQVTFVSTRADVPALVAKAETVVNAVDLAREWAHEPANVINPVSLAERAQAVAEAFGLKYTVLTDKELEAMGAGAIVAVGKGSDTPSRLIILEHAGDPAQAEQAPVALIGKAITFDTGGYSMKDVANMPGMKYDKCGGLAVIATLAAAAALNLPRRVVGVIAAAENMVSGHSYRPDDILTSLSGKTIEIISTDAEGRLVLADALTYTQRQYQPTAMIDLATLTGAMVVALGRHRAGLFSNDDKLAEALYRSGERTFERVWRMPLDDEYSEAIKSDDADIKNSGGREAGSITASAFLKEFFEPGVAWAHLDIAGQADTSAPMPYSPKGATGFGIRLLIDYLSQ